MVKPGRADLIGFNRTIPQFDSNKANGILPFPGMDISGH